MTGDSDLTSKNLYEILGCSSDASTEELKQAYHRKILESHPDKSKNATESVQTFYEVKSAWKILGDPNLKRDYDNKRRQAYLEAEGALVYARLRPSELEATEDKDIYSYQCRCGNNYLVHKSDLEESNCIIHVPCQDCTFVIAIET